MALTVEQEQVARVEASARHSGSSETGESLRRAALLVQMAQGEEDEKWPERIFLQCQSMHF
jgi:hypothetical protein